MNVNGNPLAGWSLDPAGINLIGTGLRRPECVLAQPSGDLWVADLGGGVVHIRPDGSQEVITPRDGGGPFAPAQNPDIGGNPPSALPFRERRCRTGRPASRTRSARVPGRNTTTCKSRRGGPGNGARSEAL